MPETCIEISSRLLSLLAGVIARRITGARAVVVFAAAAPDQPLRRKWTGTFLAKRITNPKACTTLIWLEFVQFLPM
jgi:hypothetical protein